MVSDGFLSVPPAPGLEPLQAAPAKSGVEIIAAPDKRPAMLNPARILFKRSLSIGVRLLLHFEIRMPKAY